jgi:hypothetical protein
MLLKGQPRLALHKTLALGLTAVNLLDCTQDTPRYTLQRIEVDTASFAEAQAIVSSAYRTSGTISMMLYEGKHSRAAGESLTSPGPGA